MPRRVSPDGPFGSHPCVCSGTTDDVKALRRRQSVGAISGQSKSSSVQRGCSFPSLWNLRQQCQWPCRSFLKNLLSARLHVMEVGRTVSLADGIRPNSFLPAWLHDRARSRQRARWRFKLVSDPGVLQRWLQAAGAAEWQHHSRQAGTPARANNPRTGGRLTPKTSGRQRKNWTGRRYFLTTTSAVTCSRSVRQVAHRPVGDQLVYLPFALSEVVVQ